jgi:hypothetical protein
MRIASLIAYEILVLSVAGSALAQSLSPSHAPFIPSTLTPNAQVGISIETPDGRDILVPLALTALKQKQAPVPPESFKLSDTSSPAWTLVPLLDASNKVVFSAKAVQDWSVDQP